MKGFRDLFDALNHGKEQEIISLEDKEKNKREDVEGGEKTARNHLMGTLPVSTKKQVTFSSIEEDGYEESKEDFEKRRTQKKQIDTTLLKRLEDNEWNKFYLESEEREQRNLIIEQARDDILNNVAISVDASNQKPDELGNIKLSGSSIGKISGTFQDGVKHIFVNKTSISWFKLDCLPDGVKSVNLSNNLKLRVFSGAPGGVNKCKNLEEIILDGCKDLLTLSMPESVKKISLIGCNKLKASIPLISKLRELSEKGCELILPPHILEPLEQVKNPSSAPASPTGGPKSTTTLSSPQTI